MAENENTWSNPKLIIPLALLIIIAAVGIPLLLHYLANIRQQANTAKTAAGDAKLASDQASALGIDQGRALAMINAARAIYNEIMGAHWYTGGVSSSLVVGALNNAQSDTEMIALETAYNGQVSNSQRNLKADVDSIDMITSSISQITHYAALT